MRAHDVRHLTFCHFCDGIGDERRMIRLSRTEDGAVAHGRCYATMRSVEELLRLPPEERGKFSIGDVGVEVARMIVDSLT